MPARPRLALAALAALPLAAGCLRNRGAPPPVSEASIVRTGGGADVREQVRVWEDSAGLVRGEWDWRVGRRVRRARIHLAGDYLASALLLMDSLSRGGAASDTHAATTIICADALAETLRYRREGVDRTAVVPSCPMTVLQRRYRATVDSLFVRLADGTRGD